MTNFNDLKNELCEKAKEKNACVSEYKRALSSENEETLLKVIYDNLGWCSENKVISNEYLSKFDSLTLLNSRVANTGLENTGFANSGDRNSGNCNSGYSNSGNWNSGYSNSGYRNSGNWNSGNWNSGYSNSGNWNSGYSNSGYRNSGNWNSGYSNSGNWNSGNRNSGYRNSGDRNSGYRNSGDSNSGYRNSGNWNSGNWNSGDRNSGDSNSGYRNSGAFSTDPNPMAILFNKPSTISVREWEQSKPYNIMVNHLNFTFWIYSSEMSDKEKKDHKSHETTGGYLKKISHKEGWSNMWGNLSESDKQSFKDIPNFTSEIFEEITGIKL